MLAKIPKISLSLFPFTNQRYIRIFAKNIYAFFSSQGKLGILGGGQLGKMLLTTRKWDISTHVLDLVQTLLALLVITLYRRF